MSNADELKTTTNIKGDHNPDTSKNINVSPDAFSLLVEGSFYQWQWTTLDLSVPVGPNAEEVTDIRKQSDDYNQTFLHRLE
jgi:hypothetical protein